MHIKLPIKFYVYISDFIFIFKIIGEYAYRVSFQVFYYFPDLFSDLIFWLFSIILKYQKPE